MIFSPHSVICEKVGFCSHFAHTHVGYLDGCCLATFDCTPCSAVERPLRRKGLCSQCAHTWAFEKTRVKQRALIFLSCSAVENVEKARLLQPVRPHLDPQDSKWEVATSDFDARHLHTHTYAHLPTPTPTKAQLPHTKS